MKWTYNIKNRLGASIALFSLCLLVLLSNYLDKLHTENVKFSISTLYDDRLIAEEYILNMTRNVYQMRETIYNNDKQIMESNSVGKLTNDFKTIFNIYIKTNLTKNEKTTAVELKLQIMELDRSMLNGNYPSSSNTSKILSLLDNLSAIQLEESKLIMKRVESQYASIKASSQFAFVIIIVILVILQMMVFSGESLIPRFKSKDPTLN